MCKRVCSTSNIGNMTYLGTHPKKKSKPVTNGWKRKIKRLASDFLVNYDEIIKYVEDNMRGDESEDILYERAHRRMMALAFDN